HLNKLKTKDGVLSVSSREALILPKGKTKKPVRWKTVDAQEMAIVRVGVQAKKIEDGGAGDASFKLAFLPAQIRLIVKKANDAGRHDRNSRTEVSCRALGGRKSDEMETESNNCTGFHRNR
ncbi:MAG: hypothetical protein ACYTE1_06390, partial [Planctomycetota bacterium]